MKIALIACRGQLPVAVYQQLIADNHEVKIITFKEVQSELTPNYSVSLGQIGNIFQYLHQHMVDNIILAGSINRPNLWHLRFDYSGLRLAFKIIRYLKKGDDTLLRCVCDYIQKNNFKLWSIADLCPKLLMPVGCLTDHKQQDHHLEAIQYGRKILNTISDFDIGQSIAVAGQVVLAIETIEGTDKMIQHVKNIDKTRINGLPKPILIKMRKKNQSNLVDLPTIGLQTINNLYKAGFAGAAFEAKGCLIIDIQAVIKQAEELKFFLIGFNND
jgi:UDP-2,3-diacylglucosamine hydrolase